MSIGKTFLVVGLGNPEGKYFQTYHNAGFTAADLLAARHTGTFKKKGNQMICDFRTSGDAKVFILKPLTYMNLSGQAVVAVMRKQKIAPGNVIVLFDDVYIDKGNIRVRFGGSGGGHNGIRSIDELLGTNKYFKIKIGIKPEKKPHTMSCYVLSKIDQESKVLVDNALGKAVDAAMMLVSGEGLGVVQGLFNQTNEEEAQR